jgi:hypothetical protein
MKRILSLVFSLFFTACTMGPDIRDGMTFGSFEGQPGRRISLEFERGNDFLLTTKMAFTTLKITPQIAVWTEDTLGRYLTTIYVTAGFGRQKWKYYKPKGDSCSRPMCMPFWLNRFINSGHAAPTPAQPLPDAVTGATPTGSFTINFTVPDTLKVFKLYTEWNRSFDYNPYYPKKHTAFNGQPSAVFRACIHLNDAARSSDTLAMVGRGGETGDDGTLYKDTERLSTALSVFGKIIAVRKN